MYIIHMAIIKKIKCHKAKYDLHLIADDPLTPWTPLRPRIAGEKQQVFMAEEEEFKGEGLRPLSNSLPLKHKQTEH